MGVFSTELGIQLSFVKTSEFRWGVKPPRYATDSKPYIIGPKVQYIAVKVHHRQTLQVQYNTISVTTQL
jgi:hypothetical protein